MLHLPHIAGVAVLGYGEQLCDLDFSDDNIIDYVCQHNEV
jgi:hypothetical protein